MWTKKKSLANKAMENIHSLTREWREDDQDPVQILEKVKKTLEVYEELEKVSNQ